MKKTMFIIVWVIWMLTTALTGTFFMIALLCRAAEACVYGLLLLPAALAINVCFYYMIEETWEIKEKES